MVTDLNAGLAGVLDVMVDKPPLPPQALITPCHRLGGAGLPFCNLFASDPPPS